MVNTDVAVWRCVMWQAGTGCPHLLRTTQYDACQTNVSYRYRQQTACIITFMQFIIVCVIVFCLWSIWPSLGLQADFCFPGFVAKLFVTENWTLLRVFIPTCELKCIGNVKMTVYHALLWGHKIKSKKCF